VTLPVLIGLGLAGGAGALARFVVDGSVASRIAGEFPFGTLVVNLSGTFAVGVIVGLVIAPDSYRVVATGFIGAYTTFSTWAFESQRLGEDGELRLGAVNFVVSLVAGVLLAWLGRTVGTAL